MFNSSNQKASNAATMEVETLTDISDFVGDHVLVVVDSRKRDLGLVRGKGGDLWEKLNDHFIVPKTLLETLPHLSKGSESKPRDVQKFFSTKINNLQKGTIPTLTLTFKL